MRKIVTLLSTVLAIFAVDSVVKNIESIDKRGVFIECDSLKVNQSGFVVRKIDNFDIIIKDAVITEKVDNRCKLSLSDSIFIAQRALPSIKEEAEVSDRVIFNSFYDKAMIVAPNLESFNKVKRKYADLEFTHPDIFATYLKANRQMMPNREDFKNFCKHLSIGLIILVNNQKEYILDSQSLGVLDSDILEYQSEAVTPFYSRAGEFKGSFFSFSDKENYLTYYEKLID